MNNISLNSQAIILLTAYFNKGDKPLTIGEYAKFANWLLENNYQPSNLLDLDNQSILTQYLDKKVSKERVTTLLNRGNSMAIALERWQNSGIWVITRADAEYPSKLKKKLGQKAPPILYGAGNKKIFNTRGVAIIGSRDASIEDLDFTFKLGEKLAFSGYSVVSGGARGVDESSMLGSINADGTTIGVVSDSLMQKVLSKKYRDAIVSGNLLLISPYYPEARFNAGNAMGRNKYIYTLAELSIVIHSGLKGGTWEGAKENLKHHWVNLFVKHCIDNSAGNHKLIEMGGMELNKDILLDNIDYLFKQTEVSPPIQKVDNRPIEDKILDLISSDKLTIKEMAEKLNETQKDIKKIIDKFLKSGDVDKHKNRPLKFSKAMKLSGLSD